jgi:trehalose utilization protein
MPAMSTYRLPLLASLVVVLVALTSARAADKPPAAPIRVLVWDEQQPAQKQAYGDKWLGETIADHLRKNPALHVKTAALKDPDQGITPDVLDHTDVLIWWGHIKHREVKWETGDQIVDRIKAGKLALIALHSAQGSTPFIRAMNARTIDDALKTLPESQRAAARLNLIYPKYTAIKRDTPLTPSVEKSVAPDGAVTLTIHLPHCVFPSWREAGEPSHVTTVVPDHPITQGIPKTWDVQHDEMYDEPFHVPTPDLTLFEMKWDKGEHHHSGLIWNLGQGKVFYFQPGHETYAVYKEELPLKVVENAALYLGSQLTTSPH